MGHACLLESPFEGGIRSNAQEPVSRGARPVLHVQELFVRMLNLRVVTLLRRCFYRLLFELRGPQPKYVRRRQVRPMVDGRLDLIS